MDWCAGRVFRSVAAFLSVLSPVIVSEFNVDPIPASSRCVRYVKNRFFHLKLVQNSVFTDL